MHDVPTPTRRSDLDAARSFAMLLGVFLHAALAYAGGIWLLNDLPGSQVLSMTITGIHGFRMQLFFLLSGFFAMMLLQKRGTRGLLAHRAKRIAIPLAVGCATIVPLMEHTWQWALAKQAEAQQETAVEAEPSERAPSDDIWTVAGHGDMIGLRAFGPDSDLLDQPDPMFGVTPLGWTALRDQPEAAAYLLEIGADPSARYRDQNTPMHTASFFGRDAVAELLLSAGADLSLANATGELPLQSLDHNEETTNFIANMVRVPIDFEQVTAGRERIRELAASGEPERASEAPSGHSALHQVLHVNFFHHLWFLWFLCFMIPGLAVASAVLAKLPAIRVPQRLVSMPLCLLWVIPLTMPAQWFMHQYGPGFGPDTSTGLIPQWHVVAYYSVFFGVGALMYAARGTGYSFGFPRSWTITLSIGIPLLFFGMTFEYSEKAAEMIGSDLLRNLLSDASQVAYAWLMIFGIINFFESFFARERRWVRYVSDSSYWLYVAHLPLVVAGQALLLDVDAGPYAKAGILTVGTTIALLVVYQFGVRYTPIGTMLNGKRRRSVRGRLVRESARKDTSTDN